MFGTSTIVVVSATGILNFAAVFFGSRFLPRGDYLSIVVPVPFPRHTTRWVLSESLQAETFLQRLLFTQHGSYKDELDNMKLPSVRKHMNRGKQPENTD